MVNAVGTVPGATTGLAEVEAAIRAIPDPEIPVISIDDLGIVRDIAVVDAPSGDLPTLRVVITPTYSGCPAMAAIEASIRHTGRQHGWEVRVRTQLAPAWTTDWMSDAGRERLREFGIAPPGPADHRTVGLVALSLSVRRVTCPLCGSDDTEEIARFGSTACKALRRCLTCREPFDEFKAI